MPKLELNRTIKKSQRGAVIVLFALLLPVLFGFMGLGIDVGLAYVEKGKVQDIADSAALAGAAKLSANGNNDMNTIKAIKSAVKSYVEANGIALDENDMLLKEADKWDAKETLDKGQDALVAYGVVSVTNSEGVAVPRVRVRITKRVPVVFLSMVDGIADNIVVSAKAAAEGGSEVKAEVSGGNPVFWAGTINAQYHDSNNLVVTDGFDFTVYISAGEYKPSMWPGKGVVYASQIKDTSFYTDADTLKVVYTPPLPDGRDFIPTSCYYFDNGEIKPSGTTISPDIWIDGKQSVEAQALAKAQAEHAYEMKQKYETNVNDASSKINAIAAEKMDYYNGEGNKRYIGLAIGSDPDNNPKIINNILPEDAGKEIDLYVNGSYLQGHEYFKGRQCVLTNAQLKGVAKVNNLIAENMLYIATDGMSYGNIYAKDTSLNIGGSSNVLSGKVWVPNGQIWTGGSNNKLLCESGSDPAIVCGQTMHLGLAYETKTVDKNGWYVDPDTGKGEAKVLPTIEISGPNQVDGSWQLYVGGSFSGQGGSGSGSSGTITEGETVKLRLVE